MARLCVDKMAEIVQGRTSEMSVDLGARASSLVLFGCYDDRSISNVRDAAIIWPSSRLNVWYSLPCGRFRQLYV
eukprot:6184141-Pleurochrysis_carterae.AAC.1